jgi:hypothetical protein
MLRLIAFIGVVFHLLGFQIHVAAADSVPRLNVGQNCASAERSAVVKGRDEEVCMSDERAAQDQAAKTWSQYAPAQDSMRRRQLISTKGTHLQTAAEKCTTDKNKCVRRRAVNNRTGCQQRERR